MAYCQSHTARLISRRATALSWEHLMGRDSAQVEQRLPVQVKGCREDLSSALTGVAQEISVPVGAFLKVPSQGLHLHTSNKFRPFVSLQKPHKSANLKEKCYGPA